jgi:hypothetical protein
MEDGVIVDFGNVAVRFTSEGKISVIDAIRAVGGLEHAGAVWEKLKTEHPEVLDHCEDYSFQIEGPVPVVNSEGWDKICAVLVECLPEF